jgi:hypothetical protein
VPRIDTPGRTAEEESDVIRRVLTATALLGCTFAIAAPTTLLGDTLTFSRAYPDPQTPYGVAPLSATTQVVAGTTDQVAWSSLGGWGAESGTTYARFNPEIYSIEVTLPSLGIYLDTPFPGFDGYVITGFSHDIVSASALYPGVTVTWLNRELRLDLVGGVPVGNFSVLLELAADDSGQDVPEPGAGWLAGTALLLAAGARRFKARA